MPTKHFAEPQNNNNASYVKKGWKSADRVCKYCGRTETKMIVAYFISGFECEDTDACIDFSQDRLAQGLPPQLPQPEPQPSTTAPEPHPDEFAPNLPPDPDPLPETHPEPPFLPGALSPALMGV